ncbi:hypothetical protein FHX42_000993 [Saccharopolyspora lacisalsi]|uniref:DUF742 domain-containing protein n=1 Tax=Halosaccharopolyspora lacisalsi TaxID=1000566 RepID=A0A839DQ82_9PSEU|nr:DUF742 domain-containing protein [Halosaccharopolyspora lacisalsi]MBA8823664.1 hypothetical protein [Halosaccharopolyspora lacisalsi]
MVIRSDEPGDAPGGREVRSRRVRPYALTGGRTRSRHQLLVETMISVPSYDAEFAETLLPESRSLYENARSPVSLAELSASLSIPLGVIRILVSDLAAEEAVFIHPTGHTYQYDHTILERILDGLNKLSA